MPVNQGYGFGILSGLNHASGEIIGWTHADMQTDPLDVLESLKLFQQAENPERIFTKGWRYGRPVSDTFFTAGMSVFESVLMGQILRDVNAQPTMFHRTFFEGLNDPPHDFSLDLYAYAMANKKGLKVLRHRVHFGEREHGQSSWNIDFASKVKFIKRTLAYSFALRKDFSKPSGKA